MAARVPLRARDVPVDVAFGYWVQSLEGLGYHSVHENFHEWPGSNGRYGDTPGLSWEEGYDFTMKPSENSAVVFPMTVERWQVKFSGRTCSLSSRLASDGAVAAAAAAAAATQAFDDPASASQIPLTASRLPVAEAGVPPPPMMPSAAMQPPVVPTTTSSKQPGLGTMTTSQSTGTPASPVAASGGVDCWTGMGGRPQAWHLVCCQFNWSGCWGGDFTQELCCSRSPPPKSPVSDMSSDDGMEMLKTFLNFTQDELQLLLTAVAAAVANRTLGGGGTLLGSSSSSSSVRRFGCLTPEDCAREAFATLYQEFWKVGYLPLRHPWLTDVQDHLFGVAMQLRSLNDGRMPKGHEHTFERVQLAEWLQMSAEHISRDDLPGEKRCLEWDSRSVTRHFFKDHCKNFDIIAYNGDDVAQVHTSDAGSRTYVVDFHRADQVVPANETAIVVCQQIFEHLRRPHLGMEQLFRLVAPGGWVVWSAPLFSEIHGAPDDYYRYTPAGAKALAEDAGFSLAGLYAPGTLQEMAGYLLGMTAPYWSKEQLLADAASTWPLQVYMLLHKPAT
eukprot:TRINITY_DN23627_c0_g3_i1.p1 TRINITY_DN23627_c0_g3~~TRINITY_DN23627_c0_g3_i1.p1  ORF type:complete len:576 (+),score=134.98 TRINITY_DN23627_c0_g3_i1:56-1729(+)